MDYNTLLEKNLIKIWDANFPNCEPIQYTEKDNLIEGV